MDCNCPAPTALTAIDPQDCAVNMSQVQRLAFQRIGTSFDTAGTPATDILELADWQANVSAIDATKIVVTPLIGGDPIIEPGDAITTGGNDNSTLNGLEEIEGVGPSNFTAIFKSLSPAIEKQLKALICEPRLQVYFFLQGGSIASKKVTSTEFTGLVSQNVFLKDRRNAGFGTKDTFDFSFKLPAGWSEDMEIVKPNFNPLTDL